MRGEIKCLLPGILLILFLSHFSPHLAAQTDVLVNLRFYAGIRAATVPSSSVTTSYYLEPLFVGNIVSHFNKKEEKSELMRVFNLTDIKLMTEVRWEWPYQSRSRKQFQLIILNRHEFLAQLTMLDKSDTFRLEVVERGQEEGQAQLETEIVLPQEKSAVFGFEDSQGKPYFVSFLREKDVQNPVAEEIPLSSADQALQGEDVQGSVQDLNDGMESINPPGTAEIDYPLRVSGLKQPKLIHKVLPQYPRLALLQDISGRVVLEATTDKSGKVVDLQIILGHPLLRRAALEAINQWRYEPYYLNGKPQPVKFTVLVNFGLDQKNSQQSQSLLGSSRKSVTNSWIWPVKGSIIQGFGNSRNFSTGERTFHPGIDIRPQRGSTIIAPARGTVTEISDEGELGVKVIVDHGKGYTSEYHHLWASFVQEGDKIKLGQVLGLVGSGGDKSLPHLHLEVRFQGKPINPLELIKNR